MRKPQGYATLYEPTGEIKEWDTITCTHCNSIVFMQPGNDIGGFCRLCMKHICGPCVDIGSCEPFEKKLETIEASYRQSLRR